MPLTPGTRLGPYEIVGPLGAGGMGEVYRAIDTRLGRPVAVKVLPEELASHSERLRRFEQEARAASALNHPNILTIYDVAAPESKTPYLVTELLEGQNLRLVIDRQPMAAGRALDYALQIANGLAAAHAQGIVHRDLKPENLFVTRDGRVKILDFGLARLTRPAEEKSGSEATAATLTSAGTVVGTVAYLAPEQLSGQPADSRSDVFTFGAVLHEMLTGKPTFQRETPAATMAAILRDQPEGLADLRPDAPRPLVRLAERCLAKNPGERPASGREVLLALEISGAASPSGAQPLAAQQAPAPGWWRAAERVGLFALGAALAIAGLVTVSGRAKPASPTLFVSSLEFPEAYGSLLTWSYAGQVAASPSGTRLAYVGTARDGRSAVFVRDLGTTALRELPGTANAQGPFWSPDGLFVGFIAEDRLRKVAADGGPVQILCDAPEQEAETAGVAWNRGGVILFASAGRLMRVSAEGGKPQVVRERAHGEVALKFPSFLPDGRHYLYLAQQADGPSRVYAAPLDGSDAPTLVREGQSRAVVTSSGHLLFVQDGVLFAQRFDRHSLKTTGAPQRIATRVANNPGNGHASFSVGERGPLFLAEIGQSRSEITERDREGHVGRRLTDVGRYIGPVLAPGGRQVAVEIEDEDNSQHAIWILDAARAGRSRLTRPPHDSHMPVWSPDGKQIAFSSSRTGRWLVYTQRTDGVGDAVLLADRPEWRFLSARVWTSDGQAIVAAARETGGRRRLWLLPAAGSGEPRPLVDGDWSSLSPDGRWLAVASNEQGRTQVFVWPFPRLDTRIPVSPDGGTWPRFRPDGRELFYVSDDRRLMSVKLAPGLDFDPSRPTVLFPLSGFDEGSVNAPPVYDINARGDGFVLCLRPEHFSPPGVTVVSGWETLAP
jgi:eukaryotic-like serine/threonine-protein kinase